MNETSPCQRCARALGSSCCQVQEGDRLATLTLADVARIERGTKVSRARFLEEEWLSWEEAAAYERRRPSYEGYFREVPCRWTLQRRDGACVFFAAEHGCTLDRATRPTACLLYPFEPAPDGGWMLQVDRFPSLGEAAASDERGCLAVQEASGWGDLARALRTNEMELAELRHRLRDEVVSQTRHSHSQGTSAKVRRVP